MKLFQVILLYHLFSAVLGKTITFENPCGDWEPYKDEKCLKIFTEAGLLGYEDAENYCANTGESNLLSIGLEEKQKFVVSLLQSNDIVDNVWLGLKYVNNEYKWSDGTELHYTNWAVDSPKNDSNHCVQIQTDETELGEWSDIQCAKKNLVICEKIQSWSPSYVQNRILELQFAMNESRGTENELDKRVTELESLNSQLETKVENLENEVKEIFENPVPIGFIYAQLPSQEEPTAIWPSTQWQDVSSDYAGLFFRTVGGNSASFGTVQEEDSPRLVSLRIIETYKYYLNEIQIAADQEYGGILNTGGATDDYAWRLQAKVSKAEVRPRNMAMKIWKRIK